MRAALLLMCGPLTLAGCQGVGLKAKTPDGERPSRQVMAECSRQAIQAYQEAGTTSMRRLLKQSGRRADRRQRRVGQRRQTKRWYDLVARCLVGKGYTVRVYCWDCRD